MSSAIIEGSSRKLLASFVSTLAVGGSYTSAILDISNCKTIVGIYNAGSSNGILKFEQSGVSSFFDVSSTIAHTPGATLLNWTCFGQFGRLGISTVNSSAGELMRLHVFGVPI